MAQSGREWHAGEHSSQQGPTFGAQEVLRQFGERCGAAAEAEGEVLAGVGFVQANGGQQAVRQRQEGRQLSAHQRVAHEAGGVASAEAQSALPARRREKFNKRRMRRFGHSVELS